MGILVMQKNYLWFIMIYILKIFFIKKYQNLILNILNIILMVEKFYLENIGFLIMIADFGNSQSLLILEFDNRYTYSKIKNMIKNNYDLVLLNKILFSYEYKKIIRYIFSL